MKKRYFSCNHHIVLILVCLFFIGCKDSEQAQVRKNAVENIDAGQRLMQASQEKTPLSSQEIQSVGKAVTGKKQLSESDRQRLANNVFERMSGDMGIGVFDKTVEEINQMPAEVSTLKPQDVEVYCSRLARLSRELLSVSQWFAAASERESREHLAQAEERLQKAYQMSRQQDTREYRTAAGMLLGTIKLMQARKMRDDLFAKDADIQGLVGNATSWIVDISELDNSIYQARANRPAESLAALEKQQSSIVSMIEATQKTITSLEQLEQRFQSVLKANLNMAHDLHQEHLQLLEKADESEGDEKYELRKKAYQVQMGRDQAASVDAMNAAEGGILSLENAAAVLDILAVTENGSKGEFHYERNAEIAQAWQETVQERIDYHKGVLKRYQDHFERIENTIVTLKTADIFNVDIDQSIAFDLQNKDQLVETVMEKLDVLKNLEKEYNTLRVSVVDSYTEAQNYFSHVNAFSEEMVEYIIKPELKAVWESDASHYETLGSVVGLLTMVKELQDKVSPMVDTFKGALLEAQNSAADIELKPQEPAATPGPEMPDEEAEIDGTTDAAVEEDGDTAATEAETPPDVDGDGMENDPFGGGFQ